MNIEMIRAAALRLDGHTRTTPLLHSPHLDALAGRRVLVKPECLQKTGSFKYRGGRAAVSALAAKGETSGVIAFSSGNHAQGVALAAREFGLPAVIVMPSDAPRVKIDNTRALGAEVVLYDRGSEDRDEIGKEIAEVRGLTLVKPFDEPEVIAGQGTTGLEIAAQAHLAGVERANVLVCCGGGGLSAGIALALEADAPGLTVRTVEPEGFDDVARSLQTGQIASNERTSGGLCDAILTPSPGAITFPILVRLCGPGIVVSDEEALRAMKVAMTELKVVAEPGGAVALAAALFHPEEIEGDTVIAVISGGNVDPEILARALSHS